MRVVAHLARLEEVVVRVLAQHLDPTVSVGRVPRRVATPVVVREAAERARRAEPRPGAAVRARAVGGRDARLGNTQWSPCTAASPSSWSRARSMSRPTRARAARRGHGATRRPRSRRRAATTPAASARGHKRTGTSSDAARRHPRARARRDRGAPRPARPDRSSRERAGATAAIDVWRSAHGVGCDQPPAGRPVDHDGRGRAPAPATKLKLPSAPAPRASNVRAQRAPASRTTPRSSRATRRSSPHVGGGRTATSYKPETLRCSGAKRPRGRAAGRLASRRDGVAPPTAPAAPSARVHAPRARARVVRSSTTHDVVEPRGCRRPAAYRGDATYGR